MMRGEEEEGGGGGGGWWRHGRRGGRNGYGWAVWIGLGPLVNLFVMCV
jgi:hypothetical protein